MIWVYQVAPINIQIVIVIGHTRVKISFWQANYIKLANRCVSFKEKYFGKIMRKYTFKIPVTNRETLLRDGFCAWFDFDVTT